MPIRRAGRARPRTSSGTPARLPVKRTCRAASRSEQEASNASQARPRLGACLRASRRFGLRSAGCGAERDRGAGACARRAISQSQRRTSAGSARRFASQAPDPTIAERIARGDMLLRTKDYERAIDDVQQGGRAVPQGKAPERPTPTRSFLLGETYMKTQPVPLGAPALPRDRRSGVAELLTTSYAGRSSAASSTSRLRTDDLASLDDVFARLNALAGNGRERARCRTRAARRCTPRRTTRAPSRGQRRASWLASTRTRRSTCSASSLMKEASPAATPAVAASGAGGDATCKHRRCAARALCGAIEQFRKVTRIPADTPTHRHVIDLAWMADRALVLRDRQLPGRGRGLQPRRSHLARVRDDALRARLGLRAPRRLPARPARARGAHDHRSRTASKSPTARCCAPT